MILTGILEEPVNFFYLYYGMTLCPFTLPKFEKEERARGGTNLLIASTDPWVVDGVGGNRGCKDNPSETDIILRELNKAMDIDALIGSGCKKHKTSVGAIRINLSSEEKESGALLEIPPLLDPKNSPVALIIERVPVKTEAHNKELADTKAELNRVHEMYHKITEENEIINEKQGVFIERLAIMEMKVEECEVKLPLERERERHITAEAELKRVTARHFTKLERIIRECKDTFDVRKVDFDELIDVDMSILGFIVFSPSRPTWDSFVAIWKGDLYLEEGEDSATVDMAYFVVGDDVKLIPLLVIGGATIVSSTGKGVTLVNTD
ncbi:hypothetical protein J1N35_008219 [Gossypium stocksii]|uniref:Uncharacterized protein n=1 Tax=Gossypium stocksii TaxID=47602 RepID=A0A9D4AGH0_9ROSI|nr:hypothetical protein J1N35_008219 [Gossypium stocksii]